MKVVIFIEETGTVVSGKSAELLFAAGQLGEVTAVVMDEPALAEDVAAYGVDVLLTTAKGSSLEAAAAAVVQAAKKVGADAILFCASLQGKDLAPIVAAQLETGCITDVIAMEQAEGGFIVTRPAYGGAVLEKMTFAEGKPAVLSLRAGSFEKAAPGAQGSVTPFSVEAVEEKVTLLETVAEVAELVNLEGAEVIVAGGRGCQNAETFALVKELAQLLGGVVGASRPAIEEGWVSKAHQIGQSGKIVAPKLYIACGISGSMQHVSGITGSDYIVAINKDEDASIFDVADLSIVGKCEEILPLLIEEVKKSRA